MERIIRVGNEHYILAASALADDRTRVLKQGETFAVFNRYGDIQPIGLGEQGIFHQGTRFLSRFELLLGNAHPFLLSSTLRQDNALLAVDLTNPDLYVDEGTFVPRGTLHLSRAKLLWQATCHERLQFTNYGRHPLTVAVTVQFEADFADIFEVRGKRRARRGTTTSEVHSDGSVTISYTGLDGVVRRSHLASSSAPSSVDSAAMHFEIFLEPKEETTVTLAMAFQIDGARPRPTSFAGARAASTHALETAGSHYSRIYSTNEQFNDWMNRSIDDLCMMTTDLPEGRYPYAGVPWFSAAFGRDGIVTAMEALWVNPDLARGVLGFLAATQADAMNAAQDAEPGKIIHETRKGEMAALKEVPFERYYGSIDATPLFVMLAGAYYDRTGDLAWITRIWPSIERALRWIDTYGDRDGDGFVEYHRQSPKGLVQQGWKDSHDSVFHADGTLAEGPLALCEVQGYVYAAKKAAAKLAEVVGEAEQAENLTGQADSLREAFDRAFWSDELASYVLALDGRKRPCRVRASNAGHCLFAEIAKPERAEVLVKTLLSDEFFSGWGIRTLSTKEVRYNPMSYHNGSVWPHDNALIAFGLSRYGYHEQVHQIMAGLLDISLYVDLHRLPELVCGFDRRPGEGPTVYPVACAPQSWAAGAALLLLQACLGLSFDASGGRMRFCRASLPRFLEGIQIKNLRVGSGSTDVGVVRTEEAVAINALRQEGELEVVTVR